MINAKPPKNYDEQVSILIHHGLQIDNNIEAKDFLSRVNYYRFTGYLVPYREDKGHSTLDKSKNPVFSNIVSEYEFDRELRNFLLNYLETIEINFRSLIAYEWSMGMCKSPNHDQHYTYSLYSDCIEAQKILNSARSKSHESTELIVLNHQIEKHKGLHTWVIVELLSFSQLSKLYKALPDDIKNNIAKRVGLEEQLVERRLHYLSVLRNRCAHAGRLFKTPLLLKHDDYLTRSTLRNNPELNQDELFAYIVSMTALLPTVQIKRDFIADFELLLKKYDGKVDKAGIGVLDNYVEILLNQSKSKDDLINENIEKDNVIEQYKKDSINRKEYWTKRRDKIVEGVRNVTALLLLVFFGIMGFWTTLQINIRSDQALYSLGTASVFLLIIILSMTVGDIRTAINNRLRSWITPIATKYVKKKMPPQDREYL